MDADGSNQTRLTRNNETDSATSWSPDGSQIVFSSTRDGGIPNLFKANINRPPGEEEPLFKSDHPQKPLSWSPDGRYILYEDQDPDTGPDLWFLPSSGAEKPIEFLRTRDNESQAQFSPDGRWITYVSNSSGRQEVYVQKFELPSTGNKSQVVSMRGGQQPRWSEDGKEIFFLSQSGIEELVSVSVEAKAPDLFRIGAPRSLLSQYDILTGNQRNSYDVTKDGRFLLNIIPRPTGLGPPITVIVNWTSLLKESEPPSN